MRTTGDACVLAAAALLLLGLAQGLDPIVDSIDVEGEILQGGTELVSASGDLRDGIVHRAELETATGEACGSTSFTAAINAYAFLPSLTGSAPPQQDSRALVEWAVGTVDAPMLSIERPLVITEVGDFAAGLDTPTGMTAIGDTLYIIDDTGDELWSSSTTAPASATEVGDFPAGLLQPVAMTEIGSTLYIIDGNFSLQGELWSSSTTAPASATEVGDFPAGMVNPRGMTAVGNILYIVTSASRQLWSSSTTAPASATMVGTLPAALGTPAGVTAIGSTLYIGASSLWTSSLTDPASAVSLGNWPAGLSLPSMAHVGSDLYIADDFGAEELWTTAGQTATCIEWRYVTASDNPRAYAATDAEGRIVSWWASEDPAAEPALANVTDWTGATYTPMQVSMPPDDVLTGLYAARDGALAGLRAELSSRGWSTAGADVESLVDNVPAQGCGTVNGDCQPMARLLALRALAAARGETVFSLVSRETRIAADGTWSLAP